MHCVLIKWYNDVTQIRFTPYKFFEIYKHEKIFLKILAIYNYITIIINEGGEIENKQIKTNSSNLFSSLKISDYKLLRS